MLEHTFNVVEYLSKEQTYDKSIHTSLKEQDTHLGRDDHFYQILSKRIAGRTYEGIGSKRREGGRIPKR